MVVPTHRRPDRLARLLDALAHQTLAPDRFEVVVVDDASGDRTGSVLEACRSSGLRLEVLTQERNRGPAVARNRGWRAARADLLAFTDDDCVPEPGWLEAGLDALTGHPNRGVMQGRTVPAEHGPTGRWVVRREVAEPSPWFEACNVFYRREALEEAGGFDEDIGWFGEDTAAGWGAVDAGWQRGFAADAVVVHDLDDRGMRWRVRHALLERNLVGLSLRHPGLRAEWFWRPWSLEAKGPAVAAAVVGLAASLRWRPAALAALPWVWRRRHLLRRDPVLAAGVLVVDVAQLAGHLAGSVPHRTVVL